MIKLSDDEIIQLLAEKGIHKRSAEEAEEEESFEQWEDDHQEL